MRPRTRPRSQSRSPIARPGVKVPDQVAAPRGPARAVDIELVADDEEWLAVEWNDRVGGIRIEPIGKPIDIGMVAVAERRIACGNTASRPRLRISARTS